MNKKIALSLLLIADTISTPIFADIISPSTLPKYVPSGARQAAIWKQKIPQGWSAITPWGQAIGNGSIEIKSFEIWCDFGKVTKIISNDLTTIGASSHKADPWFDEYYGLIEPTKTPRGTLTLPVEEGRITHWWLKTPRPQAINAKNCYIKSEMKINKGVFASVGGDYWINSGEQTSSKDTNMVIGISNWYGYNSGWQTIIMGRGYTPPSRIYPNKSN